MKSTGIVRKMDELGRIVVPIEIRRSLGIKERDPLEIFTDRDTIVLRKHVPDMSCQITGEVSNSNLVLAGGKLILSKEIAKQLVEEINSMVGK